MKITHDFQSLNNTIDTYLFSWIYIYNIYDLEFSML